MPIGAARAGVMSGGDVIPDSGLYRLTLDGTSATDSWNDNDFSLVDAPTTGVPGLATTYDSGTAYSFDGSNDAIALGEALDISTGWSFAFWTDLDGTIDDFDTIFEAIFFAGDANTYIRFVYDGATDDLNLTVRNAEGGDAQTTVSDTSPTTAAPVFYTLVGESNGDIRLYKNDASEIGADTTTFSGFSNFTANVDGDIQYANGRSSGASDFTPMDLDECPAYTKGLSPTEVSDLYNTGSI
jgi:hypothetical protein